MSAPTVPCPTCQATLRIPDGAEMVRCPRCKTVLSVGAPEPPPPPPPPVRAAVPLPFGRPMAAATPAAPAEPVPAVPGKNKTARLVHDEDPTETADREARRESIRRAADEKEREEKRLAKLAAECAPAQQGVTVLGWAAAIYAAALGLSFLYAVCYVLNLTALMAPLLYLAALLGAVNWVLSVGGLGLCVYGPRAVRPMAASALIFAIVHAILFAVQLVRNLASFGAAAGRGDEQDLLKALTTFDVLGAVSNLNVLSDFPANVIVGLNPGWTGTAGGILELTRLVMIGILCQHYAHEGKERDLGYKALQFIVRVFVLIVTVTVVKILLKWTLSGGGIDPTWAKFGTALLSMSSAGLFLTMALIVYLQCRVLLETAEVIDPRRFGNAWYLRQEY